MRIHVALAVCAGLGERLYFVLNFPATNSGDAPFYIELAWNWLKKGVYGFPIDGQLTPVDMRTPGYPAFLASVFALAGKSHLAAMLAQIVVDLATCFLIAAMAAWLAPRESRRRVLLCALWIAALCPFTANYTAALLTETLVTFLTALTLLILIETDTEAGAGGPAAAEWTFWGRGGGAQRWFAAGLVAGLGTLVRPETPLILAAAGLVLAWRWRRPRDWMKLLRAGALMAAGLAMALLPWAARNWRTLHEVQFLAPRYSQLPGEVVPRGFTAWTDTWLWRMRDVYLVTWNLNDSPISLDDIPASAFDSPAERERVCDLLDQYNDTLTETTEMDDQFAEIARERTARHPLRTHVTIPALRSLALWFTPRVELLPLSGHLWPLWQEWDEDTLDFLVTLAFVLINAALVALALCGAWRARARPGVALLLVFIALRTAFFASFVDTPEPRYVLECFPALLALAALAFMRAGGASTHSRNNTFAATPNSPVQVSSTGSG
jgi:4-amino-4-deoxy-L-arabinose transferase-like glycosyltransferase